MLVGVVNRLGITTFPFSAPYTYIHVATYICIRCGLYANTGICDKIIFFFLCESLHESVCNQ